MAKQQQAYDQTHVAQEEDQELSLETLLVLAFLNKSSNRYTLLDRIHRNGVNLEEAKTDKTIFLSERAKKILRVLLEMISRRGHAIVTHAYMQKITNCGNRQNINILNQLLSVIQYKKQKVIQGRKFHYVYVVRLATSIQQEIKESESLKNDDLWKKISTPICKNRFSSKLENRSEISNYSENSNIQENENDEPETNPETTTIIQPEETSRRTNQPVVPPARKHGTKYPNQYSKPKALDEIEPITAEECIRLQRLSGRDFNQKAMNQIVQDMGKKLDRSCESRWQFIRYFTLALINERRQAVQMNNANYKITARMTKEELVEHTTQAQRENYLNDVENRGYTHRNDENQYRAKIAAKLPISLAYNFLTNLKTVRKVGVIFELHMAKKVEITPNYCGTLLDDANAVGGYNGVEKLEFVI